MSGDDLLRGADETELKSKQTLREWQSTLVWVPHTLTACWDSKHISVHFQYTRGILEHWCVKSLTFLCTTWFRSPLSQFCYHLVNIFKCFFYFCTPQHSHLPPWCVIYLSFPHFCPLLVTFSTVGSPWMSYVKFTTGKTHCSVELLWHTHTHTFSCLKYTVCFCYPTSTKRTWEKLCLSDVEMV